MPKRGNLQTDFSNCATNGKKKKKRKTKENHMEVNVGVVSDYLYIWWMLPGFTLEAKLVSSNHLTEFKQDHKVHSLKCINKQRSTCKRKFDSVVTRAHTGPSVAFCFVFCLHLSLFSFVVRINCRYDKLYLLTKLWCKGIFQLKQAARDWVWSFVVELN